jgi:SHS2 domain-containing protein
MAAGGYEFFDHTADLGIRASGATLAELLTHLAAGLTAVIAEDSRLEPRDARQLALTAADAEELALRWLQELLFWFSTDRFLPARCAFERAEPTELRATVEGETFDPARHAQGREVKAITRHELAVRRGAGGWTAQVIVDI